MKKYAIIVAGGSGNRMQTNIPKQFLMLKGKPILYYAINTFLKTFTDCSIILVLPEEHIAAGQEIIDAFFGYERIELTVGGRTRFHSVQNGLLKVKDNDCVIFVHDAVRPFVDSELLQNCYNCVLENGSAVPVIECKDSVRMLVEKGNETVDRNLVKLVQTPQAFHSKIILPAFFGIDYKDKFTDEATVVEAFGLNISLVNGNTNNIKITNPTDLILAESILDSIDYKTTTTS